MRIACARTSQPSALAIVHEIPGTVELFMSSQKEGDVNWGRRVANTELNPDISNTVNKHVMRRLFREHNVPAPKLWRAEEALNLYLWDNGPLVGRPDRHSKGRGFWLCRSAQDVREAMWGTRRKAAATHFMEFVVAPREYRVHIFKGKSIRISQKLFGETGTTAHGNYITVKPSHPVKHVRRAAKNAVAAVGLDFGAVDILADDDNCWVLEVNAAPGLGGTMPKLWAETFLRWERGDWE